MIAFEPMDLDALIASVRPLAQAPTDDEGALCFFLERIVWGPDRIAVIGPELEYPHGPYPADCIAADRMGALVRCKTAMQHELIMWPWLDLTIGRERTELLAIHTRKGRRLRATPRIRGHYRTLIRTGFFGV